MIAILSAFLVDITKWTINPLIFIIIIHDDIHALIEEREKDSN